tara:strand:- start:13359 stop:13517 length:159 start_codon:yes stop_codon:yes gene_type:complete
MTYSEDVPHNRATQETQEFLIHRIEALQKRVLYLEAQNEVLEQEFNISNLNK